MRQPPRLEFDGKAEFGEAFDEAACLRLGPPTIEVNGSEIFIKRAVFEHVIGGREDGGGNSADRFLRPASTAQSHELRMQVRGFGARGGPSALNEHGLEPGAPRRRRVDRRLPALSSLRGHRPAEERRCAALANRPMSVPISDRMTWALSSLTPGIVLSCLTASRKQARPASTSRSIAAMPASSASICCRWRPSRKQWCRLTRPRKASRSLACGARTLGCASAASLAGSVSPAISAWIIARPLRPMTSDRTDSSLMLASSKVFCRRWTWLAFSRTSCLRVRSNPRSSWIAGPGTKLARISPCASRDRKSTRLNSSHLVISYAVFCLKKKKKNYKKDWQRQKKTTKP